MMGQRAAGLAMVTMGLVGLGWLAGCADTAQPRAGAEAALTVTEGPPPDWLDRPNQTKEELCAVGVSGPSYYLEDALKNSHAQALTELARSVRVDVISGMDVSVSGGGDQYQTHVSERANLTTEAVVHDATVKGKWVSPGGYPTRGEKGTVYTLVCVPRSHPLGRP